MDNTTKKISSTRTDSETQYMELIARVKQLEDREVNKLGGKLLPIWANDKREIGRAHV